MSKIELSFDELRSYLKKTSIPTVVVEGKDDQGMYTKFKSKYEKYEFSFIKAGCRGKVLKLAEDESLQNDNVAFLIDQDVDLIKGRSEMLKSKGTNIVITNGYSIENDIIMGSLDTLMKFLNNSEIEISNDMLKMLGIWFVHELLCDEPTFKTHIDQTIANKTETEVNQMYPLDNVGRQIFELIQDDLLRFVRGKNILQVFQHITSKKGRHTRYNQSQLLDICLCANDSNENIEEIFNELNFMLA